MQLIMAILGLIYLACIIFLFCYSLIQAHLLWLYFRSSKKRKKKPVPLSDYFRCVTVQLPVFNELYVAERLIDCIVRLEWPREMLDIQVLDDSTDETAVLIASKVAGLQQKGINICHIRRSVRQGYKAGALANALPRVKGEFIGIFDADFLPESDFLMKTIPFFQDPGIGMIQTRWEHLNENYSLLTRVQAFGLNAHFSVEQGGRNSGKHFMNFNGTAGIWRKKCIEAAGNWQADTLSEDLDLSYRAQAKGWRFLFLEDVDSPAELPVTMSAYKTQQYRWNKGTAECARKNLSEVLKMHIPLPTKLHAFFHLMNSAVFLCIFTAALCSVPLLYLKNVYTIHGIAVLAGLLPAAGFAIAGLLYLVSTVRHTERPFKNFMLHFPLFISVSMGMSLHNSIAVAEGYLGRKTAFIRTPKFNINNRESAWKGNKYLNRNINGIMFMELLLTFYFLTGALMDVYLGDYGFIPFHLMLVTGFGLVSFYSFKHAGVFGKA